MTMTEPQTPEARDIQTSGGNYSEQIGRHYIQAETVHIYETAPSPSTPSTNNGNVGANQRQLAFAMPAAGGAIAGSIDEIDQAKLKVIKTKLIHDEHKFDGKLVLIQVDIYEHLLPREVCIKLSISFGVPEINIPNFNPLLRLKNKTTDIKYGIKNGELNLDFQNGNMPLNRRENIINEKNNWEGTAVGSIPSWQFSINNESKSGNQIEILHGNLKNEVLGILELLDLNVASEIHAYFKISVNRINIAIIDLDDGTNKKQKETKIGLLLKYLKSELENYVSKVVIRYEPASFS